MPKCIGILSTITRHAPPTRHFPARCFAPPRAHRKRTAQAKLAERDTQIAERGTQISDRDTQLAERATELESKNKQLAEKEETNSWAFMLIDKRDATIAAHATTITAAEATIAERDRTLAERDEMIAVRDGELGELRDRAKATAAKHRAALKASKQETTDALANQYRAVAARGELEGEVVEQRSAIEAHGAEIEATAVAAAAAARDEVSPSLHATVGTRPACHVHQDKRRRRGRAVPAERANECLRCVVENAPMLGGIRESLGRRPLVDVHTKNVVPLHPPARVGTCARKYRRHCASG